MQKILPKCRFCQTQLEESFVDLGMSPLCQTHVKPEDLNKYEPFFPLHAYICTECWLVQLDEFASPDEIFSDYDYFSSFSASWVQHAKNYTDFMTENLNLSSTSLVMEIASNDGYLLQHFVNKNIPVLGIEPAANVAQAAIEKGIRTEVKFLGENTAGAIREKFGAADLLLGNNVLAHVPDINDFVRGMKVLLADTGTITMEFPHLQKLIAFNQFDTIYHEHFSYLSLTTVVQVFAQHGITIFDVQEIPTHGGSLRIFGKHTKDDTREVTSQITELLKKEEDFGLTNLSTYKEFSPRVMETKRKLLSFLIEAKNAGKSVVGYGAPGKGNTLLNYCGIRQDFLDYTVDLSTQKQGKYTPGCRLPILPPSVIKETKPDYVLILPWNLQKEICEQHAYISDWGGKFVVPIPEVKIL
ncbi:MAG: methyltransferase domain-containing protein [Gammaproteobacteria bacterium]|nr:methyltransferase domain-containing protein [Gammaproteobacteria bacterium]